MRSLSRVLTYAILTAVSVVFLVPLLWGLSASVHSNADIFSDPFTWIPAKFHWSNYSNAWGSGSFGRYMFNSFFIAAIVTVGTVMLSQMAGYGLAKLKFFGSNLIFASIVSTLLVPFATIMVPVFILTRQLGWVNTFQGVIIPGLLSPSAVFFMRQYMLGVPDEMLWSARVDGANEWTIYWKIVVPLTGPVISAVGVLTFVGSWNNLLWPMLVLSDTQMYTLPLGLSNFNQEYFTNYVEMVAMSMISIIPVVFLFLFARRRLIDSIMVNGGGIKG
ncbi:MAG: carbohydrate ABC transporter permease [Alicyclobacillus sp.]|nr:carbohydrate ABC transporter permease [Alicyclobacillus sp.]